MTFEDVLDQARSMLQRRGRLTYRTLQRQFQLDDTALEDLKEELIYGQRLAVDEEGRVLVWSGATESSAAAPASPPSVRLPLVYTPPYLAEQILTSRSALEGERKQVTVLFADLKGSMELLAERDPEEARQLLDPVLERLMAAVHRYEGTVNQVMGDGIMALFGAPLAHEDHAVRACYAALAMQEALRRYTEEVRRTHGVEVQIRVGLNSGEVVVRAISNDLHMDYSAVGQTTHLAARMEQLATPGSIRLTAATLRLVEGLVQVNALGPFPVRGLLEPVEVFELVGASAIRRRLQAAAARGLTRFVGRQPELETLQQAQAQALAGHGQVVAMVGEAGVGKSRLLYEFGHSHRTQGWLVLESASVSYGKATPYFPVIDLLKRYCHVEERDDPRTIRAKVTGQILTLDEVLHATIPAVLALLDALSADSPFLTLDPPQRRQRTLEGLKRVFMRESQVQPLLLVCEDLHWIDTETQALLDSLVESLPTARVLLLVNYRPEYQHGWGSKTYYTQVRLDPLPPVSAEALLQSLLGEDPSLVALQRLLIERTEGNPFFLEESVRTLVETQVLVGAPGAYRLAQALPTIQVPATVQAVLAARIDRLPPEDKRLLQTAAVIGHEVPMPLLQAIGELPEAGLHRSLAHLQVAEFLDETRLFPEREFTFKHALTHEVTYSSLLQERRRVLHGRIVEATERVYHGRLMEQVDRLGQHAFRGEVWDKAVRYLRQAGGKAAGRSAHREAVASLEQARVALAHLPPSRDQLAQAVDVLLDLRMSLNPLGEIERTDGYLREAETLAQRLGDDERLGWVLTYMGESCRLCGALARALELCEHAVALAARHGDLRLQAAATMYLGWTQHSRGAYRSAVEALTRAVRWLDEGDLMYYRLSGSAHPSVLTRGYLARAPVELGQFTEALVWGEEAVRIAETVAQPWSLYHAYRGLGMVYLRKGDLDRAIPALERAVDAAHSGGLRQQRANVAGHLGAAYALAGRLPQATAILEEAIEQAMSTRWTVDQPEFVAYLAEVRLREQRAAEAAELATGAQTLARGQEQRGVEAWILRLLGDIATQRERPDTEEAAGHYQQALALADELGMRPLQAHCHRSLGVLYSTTGQQEQARTALSMAVDLYRAMEMTFWLPETVEALAQVQEG